MAYGESSYPQDADSTDPIGAAVGGDSGDAGASDPSRQGVPRSVLDDVFDDPDHGEPGRDRMAIHFAWEAVLLVGAAVLAALLLLRYPAALRGDALDSVLVSGTALGLLTLAAGLTLRAGAVNLAIGPAAVASALHFAENGDAGIAAVVVPAAVVAALLGLVLALVVVGLHVPGWAASLAAGLAVMVFIEQRSAPVDVQGGYDPTRYAGYLFLGFAALAVLGGLFGSIKAVRRSVGRFRPVADPAHRRGAVAAILTGGSIVLSAVLAVLAGVLLAAGGSGPVRPTTGIEWTGLALGAALLAGTSAFGRRGGVFGTLLAVALLTLFVTYRDERSWEVPLAAIAAASIVVGLVATRLVESFGRPRSATADGDGWPGEPATPARGGGRHGQQESWSSALPAQPTESRLDLWGRDHWSDTDR